MDRTCFLSLPKRPVTDHVGVPRPPRNLPQGVPPRYERLQLNAPVPRIWYPDDSIVISRGDLTEKLIQEYPNKEFDQSDIYQKQIPKDYDSLHDPMLSHYHWSPEVYEHLIKQKLITPDGRVKCSLKELNEYREYLHRLWAMEANQLRREQVEEVKEMLRILRKAEPTPEERRTLETLANKHHLLDQNLPDDLGAEIHQSLHREPGEFLEKPTEEMCLAEKRLRAKKRAIKAQNRNLKELDDWLYEQSKFLRTYDAANYGKKKARDDRLMGRWQTHNTEAELWVEEERRLRKLNEIERLRGQEERDRQVQQHRERQKKRIDAMNARRRRMVERQYEAVKKRFEEWKLPEGPLTSSPRASRLGETLAELDRFFARQEVEEKVIVEYIGDVLLEEEVVMGEYPEKGEELYFEQPTAKDITTGDLLPSTDSTKEEVTPFELPVGEGGSETFTVGAISEYKPGEESGCYVSYVDARVSPSTAAFMDVLVAGVFDKIEGKPVSEKEKKRTLSLDAERKEKMPKETLQIEDYKPGEETGCYVTYVDKKVTPSTAAFMDVLVAGVFDKIEGKPVSDKEKKRTLSLDAERKEKLPKETLQIEDYKPGEETGCYVTYVDKKVTPSTAAFMDVLVSGVFSVIEGEGKPTPAAVTDVQERDAEPVADVPQETVQIIDYKPGKETGHYVTYVDKKVTPSTAAFMDVLVSGVFNVVEGESNERTAAESNIPPPDEIKTSKMEERKAPQPEKESIPKPDKTSMPLLDESSITHMDENNITRQSKSSTPKADEGTILQLNNIPQKDESNVALLNESDISYKDETSVPQLGESFVPQFEQKPKYSLTGKSEQVVDDNVVSSVEYQSAQDKFSKASDIPRAVSQSYHEEIYESTPEDWTEQNRAPVDSPAPENNSGQEVIPTQQPESEQVSEMRSLNSDGEPENMHSSTDFYHDIC